MPGIISKAHDLARFALDGHNKVAVQMVLERLYGNSSAVGLRRDLSKAFPVPSAKLPIVVRPLRRDDDLTFLREGEEESSRFRFGQLRLVEANLPTCHVAVSTKGDICYMQWLIPAAENEQIQAHFGSQFPLLKPDEALLEGAYTIPTYRGQGIMACAMAQIAEEAVQFGARWAMTFVAPGNEPSLRGCERAGFEPYIRRNEAWRMFHRRIDFGSL
jgi:RimJ/RimL family protein N-acetyltransferase